MQVFLFLSVMILSVSSYTLKTNFTGSTFFDDWSFWTGNDPTHGEVDYVSKAVATQKGYINVNNSKVYIGCDSTNVVPKGSRGRQSVRITTNAVYQYGLFIFDLEHMPTGCATWPAWWLCGPNWPTHGEIDIIEGINVNTAVTTTLHTNDGCDMTNETATFTGHWALGQNGKPATNCYVSAKGQLANQGCSIIGTPNSYGTLFNSGDGGVYVAEWTSQFIRMFFFPRNAIPKDITSKNPDPTMWGTPYTYFTFGPNCPADHFTEQQIVINLTFCGEWAGPHFSAQCPNNGVCNDFVKNNPAAFKEAYWLINYIEVYM